MTPDSFAVLLTDLMESGVTVRATLHFSMPERSYPRAMDLLSIALKDDAFECVFKGYGVCQLPYGTAFSLVSPQVRIIDQD